MYYTIYNLSIKNIYIEKIYNLKKTIHSSKIKDLKNTFNPKVYAYMFFLIVTERSYAPIIH